jgi:calcineurin-like phosphoesterase family protein
MNWSIGVKPKMSVVWVISDLHFGHRNITKYRPEFETMDQHDHTLLDNILASVKKRDSLWILGDCFFQYHTWEYAKELSSAVDNLNFVPGNHDTDNTDRQALLKGMIGMGLFHQVGSMFKKGGFWLTNPIVDHILYITVRKTAKRAYYASYTY